MQLTCAFFLCLSLLMMINAKTYSAEESNRLRIRKLYRNNLLTRPSMKKTNHTTVAIGLGIIEVTGINPRTQIITLNVNFELKWCDDDLRWNSSELLCLKNPRNRSKLIFNARDIWTPDIVAINGPGKRAEAVKYRYPVLVICTGDVRWLYQDKLFSFCEIDVRNFPFDRQYCSILLQSIIFDSSQFQLRSLYKVVQLYNLINTEWTITHVTIEEIDLYNPHHARNFSTIRINIELVRVSRYYIIKIIVPFSIISSLALFSFCVPTDSGEKVALTVSVLLSLIIYLQLISEFVPKTERGVCTLTLYSYVLFTFVFLSCILNIFTVFIYYHGMYSLKTQVPKQQEKGLLLSVHQSLMDLNKQRRTFLKRRRNTEENLSEETDVDAMGVLYDLRYIRKLLMSMLTGQNLADFRYHLFYPQHSLQQVAVLVDRILFFIYLVSMPLSVIILWKSDNQSQLSSSTNQLFDSRKEIAEPVPIYRGCPT